MDALELIAEAQLRQKKAENNARISQQMAEHYRRRCRLLVEMIKRAPIEPPITDGQADWQKCQDIVDRFVDVISDPWADDSCIEDGQGVSHGTAKMMMASRLSDMINEAYNLGKASR